MSPTARPSLRRWIASAIAIVFALGLAIIPASSANADGIISGNLVVAGTSTPVLNEAVFLYEETAPSVYDFLTGTTSDGTTGAFAFGSRPDGNYRLVWSSANGYVADSLDFSVAGGDVTLTDVELQPSSGISGQITNLGAHSGAGIYVWAEDVNDSYSTASSLSVVASDGSFVISGIAAAGEYAVYFQTPDNLPFFDSYYGSGLDQPTDPADIVTITTVGDFVTAINVELVEAGIITGVVSSAGAPISNAHVEAYDDASGDTYFAEDVTGADGVYYLKAPAGSDYQVYAWASGYFDITYQGHLGCGCVDYDPVTVTLGDLTTAINFDLPFAEDWLDIEVIALVDDFNEWFEGDVNFYRAKTGGYGLVANETVDLDSVLYLSQTPGAHRLRFTDGTTWYSVEGDYYFDDVVDDGWLTPPNPCYIDIPSQVQGESAFIVATLVPDASCGPEPAVIVPTSTGGGSKHYGVTAPTETATPTPTPTPTPTETAEPGPGDEEASPAPTVAPEPTQGPDLAWLLWVLLGLGFIGACTLAIFLFRRR